MKATEGVRAVRKVKRGTSNGTCPSAIAGQHARRERHWIIRAVAMPVRGRHLISGTPI